MSADERQWLVFTARLRPGMRERARRVVDQGPPLDLEATGFDAHEVFLSNTEVVFVFESRGERRPLRLQAGSGALRRALAAWDELVEGTPLPAETVFSWRRGGSA